MEMLSAFNIPGELKIVFFARVNISLAIFYVFNYYLLFIEQEYMYIQQSTKHLYSICTTSAQRLSRWSNIVQINFIQMFCVSTYNRVHHDVNHIA